MPVVIPNRYIHRKVADGSGKSCDVCFKNTTSVLVTEGKEDFFYVCPLHLKDVNFCIPDPDALKEMRDSETQLVVEEWKAKQKAKEERARERAEAEKKEAESKDGKNDEGKDDSSSSSSSKPDEAKAGDAATGKDDAEKKEATTAVAPVVLGGSEPRIFNLKPPFFKRRTAKKRQAEDARRARSMMQQPNLFPSVPKDPPK